MRLLLAALFFSFQVVASNLLRVEIHKKSDHQIPIAVWQIDHEDVQGIVEHDLDRSGAFQVLKEGGRCAEGRGVFLVRGEISNRSGQWYAMVSLCGLDGQQEPISIGAIDAGDMRTLAHRIANSIHKELVGESGHFEHRLVYRAECGPTSSGRKFRLAISDCDGENGSFLTDSDTSIRTLCTDRQSGRIAYVGYRNGQTRLFVYDIESKKKGMIPIPLQSIPIAPRFSPCGKKLLFSLAMKGISSLYQYTFHDQKISLSVERGLWIDISPSYAPDGKSFVFVSDRERGRPRLYIKRQGQKSTPLSKGVGSYFSPSWSPDGNWIIFIKRKPDGYYLGIMASDGTQERLIARDHVVDAPSWAPNSRVIMFAAQQKSFAPFHLFTIDRSGRTLRRVFLEINGQKHGGDSPFWQVSQ